MPAEAIHGQEGYDLRIAWSRDTEIAQVATVCDHGYDQVVKTVNEWLHAAGDKPIDGDELRARLEALGHAPAFSGWHMSFPTRRSINEAIGYLRRARDQAFGRDE